MNLTDARATIADAVTGVNTTDGRLAGHEYRPAAVRVLDAWPVLRSVAPATFGSCAATFDVMVALGQDEQSASLTTDDVAVALIDQLGRKLATPITVTPVSLTLDGAELFALAATILIEVEQ